MKRKVQPKAPSKVKHTRHSEEYKAQALALSEKIGVSAAAKQLGHYESQLYSWRGQAKNKLDKSVLEQQLATENVRLKRQLAEQAEELAILKKAAAYFAKNVK
jgi:transposase